MRFPPAPPLAFTVSCAAALLFTRAARAEDAVSFATIVAIDHGDLVLDVGAVRGAKTGDVAELYRPLVLRHPLTGKPLRDRFLIGRVILGQVRGTLSLATPEGTPLRDPAIGDVIALRLPVAVAATGARGGPSSREWPKSEPPAPAADIVKKPFDPAPSPAPSSGSVDPDAAAVAALLASVMGSAPSARAAVYEQAARDHPTSRFAPVLLEEAAALRRAHEGPRAPTVPRLVHLALPDAVLAGKPFTLALRAAHTQAVRLHLRVPGTAAFTTRSMTAGGSGYFGASLPLELLAGPALEIFAEGDDAAGVATPLVGTADAPVVLAVEAPWAGGPKLPGMLAQASVFAEYARYDFPSSEDRAFQTEGSFGLRLGEGQLRAIRSGFGVYRGVGGTLRELDELGLKGRPVGITYGWLEAEWAPWKQTSLIGRAVIGVGRGGINGGGQAFVRIGHDRRTNLLLGGEVLGGVGIRGVAELSWNTLPRVPIALRTEVTNQPAGLAPASSTPGLSTGGSEVGARAIVQVGYRFTPAFVAFGRVSYQGRTIHHAGPGLGAGVTYEW